MSRPTFTPSQRKLQGDLLGKFESGNRRKVRQTVNSMKKEFKATLHETVQTLRKETDGRKVRKLTREAQDTRRLLQTLENVKRRIKTITTAEAKKLGFQKTRNSKLIAADKSAATQPVIPTAATAPQAETKVENPAPVVPQAEPVVPQETMATVAQMTKVEQPAPVAPAA